MAASPLPELLVTSSEPADSSARFVADGDMSVEGMLRTACEGTRLSDFGPAEFMEPLERLVAGAAAEIPFNAIGRMAFKADIYRWLTNRLRFQEDLRRHPEILEEDVSDPIVVLGLVRTEPRTRGLSLGYKF